MNDLDFEGRAIHPAARFISAVQQEGLRKSAGLILFVTLMEGHLYKINRA
jgi:hypothetical protein